MSYGGHVLNKSTDEITVKENKIYIHAKFREFALGCAVFIRNFLAGKKWSSGTVSQISGLISYNVTLVDGHVICEHVDHVCACTSSTADENPDDDVMGILVPTVSVVDTIQPIPKPVSQSDTGVPTTNRCNSD